MNIDQVKALTGEELRTKVSKLCGNKRLVLDLARDAYGNLPTTLNLLPAYDSDLNVMHAVESLLHVDQINKYVNSLIRVLASYDPVVFLWRATARQRAEAYVMAFST